MNKQLVGLIICTCLLIASSIFAAEEATKNIFPDRYDNKLARLYRPEDRIVYIFREMTLAHYNQQNNKDEAINEFLKIALNRYWLLESSEFSMHFYNDPDYYLKRVQNYISKLPCRYDQAAFSFLFACLEEDFPEIKPLSAASANIINSLDDNKNLVVYCKDIARTPSFHRKIPVLLKVATNIEEKLTNLLYELQKHFLIEDMILALDKIISTKEGKSREELIKLRKKLNIRLVRKILSNLQIQLESGLEEDAITGIAISGKNIIVTQVLYQGRLRTFVQKLQKAETARQLGCYIPIVSDLRKNFSRMKSEFTEPAVVKTLEKMDKNLDQMITVLQMKLKNKKENSQNFNNMVVYFEKRLEECKSQGLVPEL